MFPPWKKSYDKPRQNMNKQRHYFGDKGPSSQSYVFSSSHVQMWESDNKDWIPKNLCFQTVVLEKTLGQQGDQTSQFWRKSTLNILLEGLMLKLKLQYFDYLIWKVGSLEKTLMLR